MDVTQFRGDDVYVPVFIDENNVLDGAALVLKSIRPIWEHSRITYKVFTDGITNKLVGCFYKGNDGKDLEDVVLVRVYGNKTDLLIDRKAELRNMKLLHKEGLAPCLYAVFDNGLAYKYVSGVTLTVQSVVLPSVWRLVARQMAAMHRLRHDPEMSCEPILWSKSEKFLSLIPVPYTSPTKQTRFEELIKPLPVLRKELQYLKRHLTAVGSPVVFAHNDLLLGNVIYNQSKQKVTFIDYEYADYNYQAFDIGNHFAEFVGISDIDYSLYPSKQFQLCWLHEYLESSGPLNGHGECDPSEVSAEAVELLYRQVNQFTLASHFFWALWALIQAEHSNIHFDFLEYAAIRFREYYNKKEEFLSLGKDS